MQNFIEILPVGADMDCGDDRRIDGEGETDGRTERHNEGKSRF